VLCAAAVGLAAGCQRRPATPEAPSGPATTWQGVENLYGASAESKEGPVRFVFDWGDATAPETTDASFASGETARVRKTWPEVGTYPVRVMVFLDAKPDLASGWSGALNVAVLQNGVPAVDSVTGPGYVAKNVTTYFSVYGRDPDGDSVRAVVDWGDGTETLTGYRASTATFVFRRTFGTNPDTLLLTAAAQDQRGAWSELESLEVLVAASGPGVPRWMWWNNDEDHASLVTSAVLTSRAGVECIAAACRADYWFYQLRTSDGQDVDYAWTRFPEYVFTGHPAANPATGDIAAGSEEGMVYVWDSMLGNERRWPDWSHEESCDYREWSSPTWNGSKLYAGHADDSIYCFEVYPNTIVRVAAYALHATMVDAPVIDASGNVYFGTDSGYLYKMSSTLSLIWRKHLQANGEVHGPVIGADGTVYTVTDQGKVFAINPDSTTRWTRQLDSEGSRPAVSAEAVFVGVSFGRFYAVNTSDGSVRWQTQLGNSEFATTPILTTRGYLYAVNESDVLYCVRMSDGQLIWACDCPSFLPDGGRKASDQLTDYLPNPTIASNGDVIVVGEDAVYCIYGYPDGVLDTSQPWPKWQRNLYNSGKQ
jgi:outer membrane protein assembly factor BamB